MNDWKARAACRGKTSMFFGEDRSPHWEAKRLCGTCEVRMHCLELALELGEQAGVWGGYTPDERRRIIRKRRNFKVAR